LMAGVGSDGSQSDPPGACVVERVVGRLAAMER